MAKKAKNILVDGRRLRTQRSKQAIIEAAIELTNEGVLIPTAKQISDRAGVGMRSFFRRFNDMETFFEAVDSHIRDHYETVLFAPPIEGGLGERIKGLIMMHSKGFEKIKYINYATKAYLWRSKTLQKNYERNQLNLIRNIHAWFPELDEFSKVQRESVYAIASFETWSRLRREQKLSIKASKETIEYMLTILLKPS